jgi:protein TonB
VSGRGAGLLLLAGCLLTGCATTGGGTELRWLEGAPPVYPPAARAQGVEGVVLVEYRVDAEGRVREPRVVRAEPPGVFDAAALEAVRSWRYRPWRRDGRPVPLEGVQSTLRFRLGEVSDARLEELGTR